jgi:hypothetical protein
MHSHQSEISTDRDSTRHDSGLVLARRMRAKSAPHCGRVTGNYRLKKSGPYHGSLALPIAVVAACGNVGLSPTPQLLARQLQVRP